jgi:preprotein translocase subunit SecA
MMRVFGSDRVKKLMETFKIPADMPIENGLVSKSLEAAQKKVEGHNFDIRKHLVEYDDVINKHRETIYRKRLEVLSKPNLKENVLDMVKQEIDTTVNFHTAGNHEQEWNVEEIYEVVNTIFPVPPNTRLKLGEIKDQAGDNTDDQSSRSKFIGYLYKLAVLAYNEMEENVTKALGGDLSLRQIEKGMMLRSIDTLWIEHLEAIDHLRTGIGLRGYGQRDPLVEYKKEAYGLFKELLSLIQKQVVYAIFKVGLATQIAPSAMQQTANLNFQAPAKTMVKGQSAFSSDAQKTPQEREAAARKSQTPPDDKSHYQGAKIGRNDPCPCGSGKKFKKCHGK